MSIITFNKMQFSLDRCYSFKLITSKVIKKDLFDRERVSHVKDDDAVDFKVISILTTNGASIKSVRVC